ncbi:hypothetical protein DOY81_013357, partial [Sarcophaga bullata]
MDWLIRDEVSVQTPGQLFSTNEKIFLRRLPLSRFYGKTLEV